MSIQVFWTKYPWQILLIVRQLSKKMKFKNKVFTYEDSISQNMGKYYNQIDKVTH